MHKNTLIYQNSGDLMALEREKKKKMINLQKRLDNG